jgi:circadian clock protein KaiC
LESQNAQGVSSLMNTWINLRFFGSDNERNLGISIVKSKGMSHSNQICQSPLTDHGVELVEVYLGPTCDLLMSSSGAA